MILDGVVPKPAGAPSEFSMNFSRSVLVLCVNHLIACGDRYKNHIIDLGLSSADISLDVLEHRLAPVLS